MAVGDYDLQPFTSPVGADPQAWQTRNNDNLLRAKFNAHQADEVAHVQSGLASAKPASGTATGEVYIATDTGQVWIWSGSAWVSYSSGGGSPSWTSELVEVIWGTPSKSGTDYTIAATSPSFGRMQLAMYVGDTASSQVVGPLPNGALVYIRTGMAAASVRPGSGRVERFIFCKGRARIWARDPINQTSPEVLVP